MWFALPQRAHNASFASPAAAPFLLAALSAIRDLGSKPTSTLTITAVTWGIVWAYSAFKTGFLLGFDHGSRTKQCLASGILFLLAVFCERAAYSWDALWWSKAF